MDSEVVVFMRGRKEALLRKEQSLMRALTQDWLKVEKALLAEMEALAAELQTFNVMTEAQVLKHERFVKLLYQARAEVSKYNDTADVAITEMQSAMAKAGIEDALKVLKISFEDAGMVSPQFNRLPVKALEQMFGYAADGSSLRGLLAKAYPESVNGMLDALVKGLALGQNPTKTGRKMAEQFGAGLNRSLTIARTETLRSYRMASMEQYKESGVVVGYKRMAAHDSRVCAGCLFRDGEFIESLDEFDEHPNGRCTAVPVVMGVPELKWENGAQWFEKQSEAKQREILGKERFAAWQNGASLQDMSKFVSDPTWGGSYIPTPVGELV